MASTERRSASGGKTQLLTAYRCLDEKGNTTATGFGRALDLSLTGALIEVPDQFPVGQALSLEFLLDNDKLAVVEGAVTDVTSAKAFYRTTVTFAKLQATARRLIALQTGTKPKPKARPKVKPKPKPKAKPKPKRKTKK